MMKLYVSVSVPVERPRIGTLPHPLHVGFLCITIPNRPAEKTEHSTRCHNDSKNLSSPLTTKLCISLGDDNGTDVDKRSDLLAWHGTQ
mmetsp:Transcript_1784/g.2014  ORF Transcript_1784/g.2014 Transcript_1784/m.2014 type:complete len:88 (+) Transcript_1784:92-355(+)